jgi:drug/metabolite transporter (DMT)-like permease
VGRWRWIAAGIALVGALILLRPGPDSFRPGALIALAAALVIGIEIILIKRLSGRERPLTILFINNIIGMTISSVAVVAIWAPPTPAQWGALAGVGLVMALVQAAFVNSLARADASLVAPFSYATLIFATLYDLAVFGVVPDHISIIGAATILAGAAVLGWRETRAARQHAKV